MNSFRNQEQIAISKKIYCRKNFNKKAFFFSAFFHAMLFAATLFVAVPKNIVVDDSAATKNILSISLAKYTPQAATEKVLQEKEEVTKIKTKKAPVAAKKQPSKVKEKTIKTPQKMPQTVVKENVPSFETFVDAKSSEEVVEKTDTQDLLASQKPQTSSVVQAKPKQESSIDPTTLGLIRAMVQDALRYPALAKRLKLEGVVLVSFVLTQDGHVLSARVTKQSGSSSLDTKALETVLALSGTYPLLPAQTNLQIPIAFSLKQS